MGLLLWIGKPEKHYTLCIKNKEASEFTMARATNLNDKDRILLGLLPATTRELTAQLGETPYGLDVIKQLGKLRTMKAIVYNKETKEYERVEEFHCGFELGKVWR